MLSFFIGDVSFRVKVTKIPLSPETAAANQKGENICRQHTAQERPHHEDDPEGDTQNPEVLRLVSFIGNIGDRCLCDRNKSSCQPVEKPGYEKDDEGAFHDPNCEHRARNNSA
jgi:hypothetical protein